MNSASPVGGPAAAVRLTSVSKTYRLYQKPLYRFLDLFNLCPPGPAYYAEHQALANVDIEVRNGEKVAIIGRNGAGKSTMLKVITGLVQPTTGSVEVNGTISNLLQIGSGFHPDFTGRQNVFASLAHQGIVGRAAADVFDEIVEFSEIEQYIDQPMKTYSTGMCSRLMFSASIILKPELLIVDEILGVGDAYFSHKSFERMRDLCSHQGATLLLVTHDIYGAQNLCDRFIWIDRGRVKHDGDAKTAVAMYETSVKEQEEEMRRRRSVASVREVAPASTHSLHVVVRSRTGFALKRPLGVGLIELVGADGQVERLEVSAPAQPSWHLVPEGNLSAPEILGGRVCRVLRTFGSIYHKAEWIVTVPATLPLARAHVQWYYDGPDAAEFAVLRGSAVVMQRELGGGNGWQSATIDVQSATEPGPPVQMEFGSGIVRVANVQLLDANGFEVASVTHGDPLVIRALVDVNGPALGREVTFLMAFTRHGTSFAVNVIEHQLRLPPSSSAVVDVTLPAVRLGSGTWFLRLGVGEAGIFKRGTLGYFAVDEHWHHMTREGLQFEVRSADRLDSAGCFMVHEAHFSVLAADAPPEPSALREPAGGLSQ
jgi:ABC-type polysaccharide/polyol phosphate transport system ATPase subunit